MRRRYQRRRGDVLAAGCVALAAGSGALLWNLRPTSRLSQWLDRSVDRAFRIPTQEVW